MCLLLTAVLHFIHGMTEPVLMSLSASHTPSLRRHLPVLLVSLALFLLPVVLSYFLWNQYALNTWLFAVTAFCVELCLKVRSEGQRSPGQVPMTPRPSLYILYSTPCTILFEGPSAHDHESNAASHCTRPSTDLMDFTRGAIEMHFGSIRSVGSVACVKKLRNVQLFRQRRIRRPIRLRNANICKYTTVTLLGLQ